jgi:hypothetical protein
MTATVAATAAAATVIDIEDIIAHCLFCRRKGREAQINK